MGINCSKHPIHPKNKEVEQKNEASAENRQTNTVSRSHCSVKLEYDKPQKSVIINLKHQDHLSCSLKKTTKFQSGCRFFVNFQHQVSHHFSLRGSIESKRVILYRYCNIDDWDG